MKRLTSIYTTIAMGICMAGCDKEMGKNRPTGNNTAVPAQVSNITLRNLPGAAQLTFALPKDPNLLYVKAKYMLHNGEAEVKATYFSNTLLLEGFGDTLQHEVSVYSVSSGGVLSAPLIVTVKPQEPPIWSIYRSLVISNAFGGYDLRAVNETKANITIQVLTKNVFNEYDIDNAKSIYTNTDTIVSKVRNLDTIDYRFGFVVRDRWGNTTDTLYRNLKPLYEAEFSKTFFREFPLPGDAPQVGGAALRFAWDNKLGWPNTSFTNQAPGGTGPHTLTIDMGVLGRVSRVWIRPYPEVNPTRYYYLTTMKRFELWGSANPSLSGQYDNTWILLGSYTLVKPSGLPYGIDNALDVATGAAGFSWEVDLTAPKIRYLRVRCIENFAGGTAQNMNELSIYGDPR